VRGGGRLFLIERIEIILKELRALLGCQPGRDDNALLLGWNVWASGASLLSGAPP
jgi:hypothetical protein